MGRRLTSPHGEPASRIAFYIHFEQTHEELTAAQEGISIVPTFIYALPTIETIPNRGGDHHYLRSASSVLHALIYTNHTFLPHIFDFFCGLRLKPQLLTLGK